MCDISNRISNLSHPDSDCKLDTPCESLTKSNNKSILEVDKQCNLSCKNGEVGGGFIKCNNDASSSIYCNCSQPTKKSNFKCINNICTLSLDGKYKTLDDCISSGCANSNKSSSLSSGEIIGIVSGSIGILLLIYLIFVL